MKNFFLLPWQGRVRFYTRLFHVSFSDAETQSLKEHLIDELDYVLVPTEAWNKLVAWYGCIDGQQPIVRKVSMGGVGSVCHAFCIFTQLRWWLFYLI